jgi:hypothetical protein
MQVIEQTGMTDVQLNRVLKICTPSLQSTANQGRRITSVRIIPKQSKDVAASGDVAQSTGINVPPARVASLTAWPLCVLSVLLMQSQKWLNAQVGGGSGSSKLLVGARCSNLDGLAAHAV